MRRLAAALALGLIAGAAGPASADPWAAADARLSALTADPVQPVSGLAVVVVKDGRRVFAKAYGRAVIDAAAPGRERPLTLDTPVRVASISKVPVALAALRLAEEGRLDLDADLSDLLGFRFRNPHYPDRAITARMLLDHTSSLRDGEVYGLPVQHTLEELVRPNGPFDPKGDRWAAPTPGASGDRSPGAWFHYTNLNLGVLATVIERVTGERFDVAVERLVLRPAGMRAAYDVRRLDDEAFARLAPVMRRVGGVWTPQVDDWQGRRPDGMVSIFGVTATKPLSDIVPGRNATTLSPQGGLRASADDLGRLLSALIATAGGADAGLVKPATLAQALAPRWTFDPARPNGDTDGGLLRRWGLGFQCTLHAGGPGDGDRWIDAPGGPRLCGHFAEAYGLFGGFFFEPQAGWGFVYLITGTPGGTPGGAPGGALPRGGVSSLTAWETEVAAAILQGLGEGPPGPK